MPKRGWHSANGKEERDADPVSREGYGSREGPSLWPALTGKKSGGRGDIYWEGGLQD